jgi:hypothetical protein
VFLNLTLVLIFVLLIRNPANKSTWLASTVLLIAVGSAASLTNLAYFITILGMVLVYNLVKGLGRAWSRRDIAVSVAVYAGILAVASPYLVFNYREWCFRAATQPRSLGETMSRRPAGLPYPTGGDRRFSARRSHHDL